MEARRRTSSNIEMAPLPTVAASLRLPALAVLVTVLVLSGTFLFDDAGAYHTTRSSSRTTGRRGFLSASTAILIGTSSPALALDMERFANSQLSSNTPQELSNDAALCKYGSPSPATGQACLRAGLSTKVSGNVDAFGNVDRGIYVKCKQFYSNNGGTTKYEKVTVCDDGTR